MRIRLGFPAAGFILVLVACRGQNQDADSRAFVDACLSASNLPRPICECVAGKAQEELTSSGFAFLVASLAGDDATAARLRSELKIPDAMAAGMFMTSAPGRCAEELGN